jgi:hypothetical protein
MTASVPRSSVTLVSAQYNTGGAGSAFQSCYSLRPVTPRWPVPSAPIFCMRTILRIVYHQRRRTMHHSIKNSWERHGQFAYCATFHRGTTLVLNLNTGRAGIWHEDRLIGNARTMHEARTLVDRYLALVPYEA